jgi:ribosomal protein S8E
MQQRKQLGESKSAKRKKERKNNVDRKQHFPKAAGEDLPGDKESECEDESNATTMPSRDKHTDVAHEHEHSEIDVGYGSERKIRQQCSCNRCI